MAPLLRTVHTLQLKWLFVVIILIISAELTVQKKLQKSNDPCYDKEGNPRECKPGFENIALKKKVVVSETCGIPSDESFCKLVRSNGRVSRVCDVCRRTGLRSHPSKFLTDINDVGNLTFWQSKVFQSHHDGGSQRNVTLTISFGKKYELSYVYLRFFSPRPKAMIIYKSTNRGNTWVPYQYYARDCREMFNIQSREVANRTNEVLCLETSSGLYPLSGGRVVFSPSRGRTTQGDIDSSYVLQDWVTATDIKIVLTNVNEMRLESGNTRRRSVVAGIPTSSRRRSSTPLQVSSSARLPGVRETRVMKGGSNDPRPTHVGTKPSANTRDSSTRSSLKRNFGSSLFYAINDISIGGRCKCNGHASRCFLKHGKMICDCKHNTEGTNCEKCRTFYYDKPWKRATSDEANACIACNCNLHAKKCTFNAELFSKSGGKSGGVCHKCRHHTTGRFCHYCKSGFYKNNKTKSIAHRKVCKPCGCHLVGSAGKYCNPRTGQCPCKEGVAGKKCNRCAKGYEQTRSLIAPCIRIPPVRPPESDHVCAPCKRSQAVHLSVSKLCKVDFVVEIKMVAQVVVGNWVRVTLEILRPFKRGDVRLKRGPIDVRVRQRQLACVCPRFRKNRKYLLLGKYDRSTREPSLAINKNTIVLRWKSKYKRKLMALLRRTRNKDAC